ncbi:MAG TPA: glycosyl transferase [Rubellimicrobium sp.]|nr:glycosyl transferase [Rubellimicrobium sp.]
MPQEPRILYLAHDADDAAVWRRVRMMKAGGACVEVAGFRRGEGPLPGPVRLLGRTQDARLLHRIMTTGLAAARLRRSLRGMERPDAILARNLEMLALAARARHLWPGPPVRLVYEVLDIHRLMLRTDALGRALRTFERRLATPASLVLISSPGFRRHYFEPHDLLLDRIRLVENKFLATPSALPPPSGPPLAIGWFGVLRCRWSLMTLDALTRAQPGRFRIFLRGRPALDRMPDFHAIVAANPDFDYGGPYRYPDDLSAIYGAVRLVWMADRFDAGLNSDWLLPNRLYEGGAHGRIPVALEGTEVAATLRRHGIGLILPRPDAAAAAEVLDPISEQDLERLEAAMRRVPAEAWSVTEGDCTALVAAILGRAEREALRPPEAA